VEYELNEAKIEEAPAEEEESMMIDEEADLARQL
jgi:hypothetical protein